MAVREESSDCLRVKEKEGGRERELRSVLMHLTYLHTRESTISVTNLEMVCKTQDDLLASSVDTDKRKGEIIIWIK